MKKNPKHNNTRHAIEIAGAVTVTLTILSILYVYYLLG